LCLGDRRGFKNDAEVVIMTIYPAYVLPDIRENSLELRTVEFNNKYGKATIKIPKMGRRLAEDVVDKLDSGRTYLAQKSPEEISDAVRETVKLWLEPNFRYRKMAEELLPIVTGFSPQMVHTFLDGIMGNLSKELYQMRLPEKKSTIERVFCVLEEIPGPEILAVVKTLYNRSTIFCKSPSSEPLFAALYAQSFADVDKKIADCIAVAPWEGGKPEFQDLENFIYGERAATDAIVLFGNSDVAESIKQKTNSAAKFTQFTRGISFGVIGKEMLEKGKIDNTICDAALAVCMYDQRACFSPQLLYVERRGEISPKEFSEMMARKMQELEAILPRGDLFFDTSATLTELMSTYELQDLLGSAKMYAIKNDAEQAGAVIYQKDSRFETSCLYRVIKTKPVNDILEIPRLIKSSPFLEYLHTVGVATSEERKEELEKELKELGVSRVTSISGMYQPSLLEYEFLT
jgi:hypothetical protein